MVAAVAPMTSDIAAAVQSLAVAGYRILAVACGPPGEPEIVGLIAFGDPPRPDSRDLLAELKALGVGTVMVTGDAATTAATVARSVGLDGPVCPPGKIPEQRRTRRLRGVCRRFSGRQVPAGQRISAARPCRRDVRRRRQ